MLAIPLSQVANQQVEFNADGALWTVHVYQSINFVCADISRSVLPSDPEGTVGPVPLINGMRCFGGIPLLQYAWQYYPNLGNFVFDSDADWTEFGATCQLYYLEQAELTEFLTALQEGVV
jgi:hypothetical protein